MKKSLLFAMCLSALNIAVAQWQKVFTLDNIPINTIKTFSANKVIATYDNNILKTENGGASWDTTTIFFAQEFKLSFVNDTLGYACGIAHFPVGPTLYKTVNGGASWDSLSLTIGVGISQHGISFVNEDLGYVVHDNKIYKTTDGGASFDTTIFPANGYHRLNDVYFINPQIGFIACKTFDTTVMTPKGNCIYRTNDGAASWHQVYYDTIASTQNFDYKGISKIHFRSTLEGWAVGEEGIILHTTNGGNDWTSVGSNFTQHIDDVQFLNTTTGFLATEGKLYKTIDGMNMWTEQLGIDSIPYTFYAISMLTVDTGFASGHGIFKLQNEQTIGLQDLSQEEDAFVIHSNPATHYIHLQQSGQDITHMYWVNVTGNIIPIDYDKANQLIAVHHLPTGYYHLVINTAGSKQWRKKVVVIR
jgi:photosystem II stability/assembly factor-like uncharacterized protein